MKKHNALKIVLITILVFMLLTWFIPAAVFQSKVVDQGRLEMGLFDLFNYPLTALQYFGNIVLFLLAVGAFYGILYKIPAYRSFLDKFAAKFSGRGLVFIVFLIFILGIITSVAGAQLPLLIFFPLLASVILLMGYDKIVVLLTLVGSTMIGIAGTTYGYSNVYLIFNILEKTKIETNIVGKVIILFVGLFLLSIYTIQYAKRKMQVSSVMGKSKVVKSSFRKEVESRIELEKEAKEEENEEENEDEKEDDEKKSTVKSSSKKSSSKSTTKSTTKSTKKPGRPAGKNSSKTTAKKSSTKKSSGRSKNPNKADAYDNDVIVVTKDLTDYSDDLVPSSVDKNHRTLALVIIFVCMLIVLILAYIPWSEVFGVKLFTDITKNVTDFKLFKYPLFSKILGKFNAFGTWSFFEMIPVLFLSSALLAIIYKIDFNEYIDGAIKGIKKAIVPACIAILIYTGLVLVTYHPFQLTIYNFIQRLGVAKKVTTFKHINFIKMPLVAMIASIFNGDPLYVYNSTMPYLAGVFDKKTYDGIAMLFPTIYGWTMLAAPTSLVLMTSLSYLKVSFCEWLKNIWLLLLELLIAFLIILIIVI